MFDDLVEESPFKNIGSAMANEGPAQWTLQKGKEIAGIAVKPIPAQLSRDEVKNTRNLLKHFLGE